MQLDEFNLNSIGVNDGRIKRANDNDDDDDNIDNNNCENWILPISLRLNWIIVSSQNNWFLKRTVLNTQMEC